MILVDLQWRPGAGWSGGAEHQDRRRGLGRAGLGGAARGRAVAGVGADGDLRATPGRRAARRRVPGQGGAATDPPDRVRGYRARAEPLVHWVATGPGVR